MKKNLNNNPLVSVIMPVYNAGEFLLQAIQSLQNQTYTNWELIAVDDASSDSSLQILKALAKSDKRIKVYQNKSNRGVAATANTALKHVKGEFIARQDADDIAMPSRFARQVKYLQNNADVVVVGGNMYTIDKDNNIKGKMSYPTDSKKLRKMIFSSMPVAQPAFMVNTNKLPSGFKWYEGNKKTAEDVELMFKLFQYGNPANLKHVVLKYRVHGKNTSLVDPKKTFYITFGTRVKAIFQYGQYPNAKGIVVSLAQLAVVTVLPSKAIYPLFSLLRGIKRRISTSPQISTLGTNAGIA